MKKFIYIMIASFGFASSGLAQDSMTLLNWNCAGLSGDTIYALPLNPNQIEAKVDISLGPDTTTRFLWMNIIDGPNSYSRLDTIPSSGLYPLSIALSQAGGIKHVHLELLSGNTPTASADIWFIIFVQDVPSMEFLNFSQTGADIEVTVRTTDYHVFVCPDYETYVMLEGFDAMDSAVVFQESQMQLHLGPEEDYTFQSEYVGPTATLCFRTWLHVRNTADGTFTDIASVLPDSCIVVAGSPLGQTETSSEVELVWIRDGVITLSDARPAKFQVFTVDGKVVSSGSVQRGTIPLSATSGGMNILSIDYDNGERTSLRIILP